MTSYLVYLTMSSLREGVHSFISTWTWKYHPVDPLYISSLCLARLAYKLSKAAEADLLSKVAGEALYYIILYIHQEDFCTLIWFGPLIIKTDLFIFIFKNSYPNPQGRPWATVCILTIYGRHIDYIWRPRPAIRRACSNRSWPVDGQADNPNGSLVKYIEK